MSPRPDVVVIGAGVSGLTTAICLAEAGARVTIWTAALTAQTTSMAAGAMWGPYHAEPFDRVRAWSTHTLDVLCKLANRTDTGVRLVAGIEAARGPAGPPAWADQLDEFRTCDPRELPSGFSTGWRYTAPLIEMPVYLRYLQQRLADSGGSIEQRRVSRIDEAAQEAAIVVNCAGMGARDLVPDHDLFPIRGQLVVVRNPGVTEFFSEDTGDSPDLTHWYPYEETLVLGGVAQVGEWNVKPDPAVAAAIVERCAEILPSLGEAEVLGHRVGLRPTRPAVRIEEQESGTGERIVHNYGHGGAGVTLSWGCAAEVEQIVSAPR